MSENLDTAVIYLAGTGSRNFPITTTVEKAMLPIYAGKQTRAVADYTVEDCFDAGVRRIIFVTSERGEEQLRSYFEPGRLDANLREHLEAQGQGKTAVLQAEEERRDKYRGLEYEYRIQSPKDGYGTAVPLYLAKAALSGERKFAVIGGDDIIYHQDGTSELGLAIGTWERGGADYAMMGLPVTREDGPKYGILRADAHGRLLAWDERPPIERVPENPRAVISRFLLRDSIWSFVEDEMGREREGGEHYITYPILDALEADQTVQIHEVTGAYFDGGDYDGLRAASNYISEHLRAA